MTELDCLVAARELISKEENWCQHAHARSKFGGKCDVDSNEAYAFCMQGAVFRILEVEPKYASNSKLDFSRKIFGLINDFNVVYFNDNHTHTEVLALFDATIEKLVIGLEK